MPQAISFVGSNPQAAIARKAYAFMIQLYLRRGKKPVPSHMLRSLLFSEIPTQYIRHVIEEMERQHWIERVEDTNGTSYIPLANTEAL